MVQNLKNYLANADFNELAQTICDKVNGATKDLTAEKKELRQIEQKIHNGVNAVLSGLDVPELKDELDRLRVRKSELEDIISYNSTQHTKIKKESVIKLFTECVNNIDTNRKEAIKSFITKIYAHSDGSATVNMGVHINGCGGRI